MKKIFKEFISKKSVDVTEPGKYFTWSELITTYVEMDNTPVKQEKKCLKVLVQELLDPVRTILGMPIVVTSGYRTKEVNKAVGGAQNPISQHTKGQAVDLLCRDNAKLFNLIRSQFEFDQLIWEKGDEKQPAWVHVSYKQKNNRMEVLKNNNGKYIRL